MGRMLTIRADKSTRLACGLGLVLLVAAQEKAWPWLLEVPETPQRDTRATSTPATPGDDDGDKSDSEKKARPPLPHVVPDAPVPRWPAGWAEATARQALGVRDGVVSCGPREGGHQHVSPVAIPPTTAWWQMLTGHAPNPIVAAQSVQHVSDPALAVCIRRTGPPRA